MTVAKGITIIITRQANYKSSYCNHTITYIEKEKKVMAELVREIQAADIPKLHELMKTVFGDGEWTDIKRLGGMTNHSYKITRENGQEYIVRIPGDGTEEYRTGVQVGD